MRMSQRRIVTSGHNGSTIVANFVPASIQSRKQSKKIDVD